MTTDGSGNYMKLVEVDAGLEVAESKLRSYRSTAQQELQPWITETYRNNCMAVLPPIVEDGKLLKLDQTIQVASRSLREYPELEQVLLPLGMNHRTHQSYKIIKPSAFIFQTPKQ